MKLISSIILILIVFIFSVLMLSTISQYLTFQTNIGFLKFKQNIIDNKYWLVFFYIHIFSISICLLAGMTQFSSLLLTEYKKVHRAIGKIYVYNILIINFPACLVLAVFSNGGYLGIIGFLVQTILWGLFTILAIINIKKSNIQQHKIFMILSYAITTTAITFRIIKGLFFKEEYSYELFYGLNVWFSLILNMTIAFIIIKQKKTIVQS